jgi:perosamine synthetase
MAEPVAISSPDLTATDIAAVNHVLSARCLSLGPQLEAFEEAVVSCVGLDVELHERAIVL